MFEKWGVFASPPKWETAHNGANKIFSLIHTEIFTFCNKKYRVRCAIGDLIASEKNWSHFERTTGL